MPSKWGKYAVNPDTPPSGDRWSKYAAEPESPAPVSSAPLGTISAAPKPSWLQDAESDVRLGGNRTLVGKTLGRLQGSDKGYSGIGGVSPAAANFMASPVLGGIHALQGAVDDFGHPIKGNLKTLQGISEMATIPSMIAAGPETLIGKGIDAIPSRAHAGELFSDLATRAGDAGTGVRLSAASKPLGRLSELGETVANLPKAVSNLAKEDGPMAYQKARDYASAISSLSAEEKMALKPEISALLGKLKTGLHSDISSALEPIGGSGQYADALKEYSQNANLREGAKYLGKKAAQVAGAGAVYEGYQKLKKLL